MWAVAAVVVPDGRAVAVTSGKDRTVRVLHLITDAPIGQPLIGHTDDIELRTVPGLSHPLVDEPGVTGPRNDPRRRWSTRSSRSGSSNGL